MRESYCVSSREALLIYTRPHVLIIDEVGYLTYGLDAANVMFHVVNDRHLKKRPLIFTTNKPLSEWVLALERSSTSYRDFLTFLLAEEVAHRKQTRLQRCTRNATFPFWFCAGI